MNMLDLAKMINGMDFTFKVPERIAPQFILYLTGWMFGMTPSFVKRNVGIPVHFNNSKGQKELGVNYIPIETTIKEMIDSFIEHKLVKN